MDNLNLWIVFTHTAYTSSKTIVKHKINTLVVELSFGILQFSYNDIDRSQILVENIEYIWNVVFQMLLG